MNDIEKISERVKVAKGNVKGDALINHVVFIRSKEGNAGVAAIQNRLDELGHSIDIENVNRFDWHPAILVSFVMILAKETFGWDDETIIESGRFGARNSFIMRMLMRFFVSPKRLFEFLPRYWEKQYDFGKMRVVEFDEKAKKATVRIEGYKTDRMDCLAFLGYGEEMVRFATGSKSISIKEVKCEYDGDPHHEFKVGW